MATFWDGQEAQSGIIQSYDWGQEAQVDWFEAVAKLEGDNHKPECRDRIELAPNVPALGTECRGCAVSLM